MSDDPKSEAYWLKAIGAENTAAAAADPKSEDYWMAALNGDAPSAEAPKKIGWMKGALRQAGQGAAFDMLDEVAAGLDTAGGTTGDYTAAKKRWNAENEQWAKDNPNTALVSKGAGMVASMLLPTGWLGAGGKAGQALSRVLPNANAAAAIPGAAIPASKIASLIAKVPVVGKPTASAAFGTHAGQAGIAAAKAGALSRFGQGGDDTTTEGGAFHDAGSQFMNRVGAGYFDAPSIATDYALGAAGGWAGNKIAGSIAGTLERGAQMRAEGKLAAEIGSQPAVRAQQIINEDLLGTRYAGEIPLASMDHASRSMALQHVLDKVAAENIALPVVRPGTAYPITPQMEDAIVRSYHAAIENGANEAAARVAAQNAYRSASRAQWAGKGANRSPDGAGYSAKAVRDNTAKVLDAHLSSRSTPLIAAEVLSGADKPIAGQMRALTQGVMNEPGAGGSVLAKSVEARQGDTISRTRDLINDNLGDPDYIGFIEKLSTKSRAAKQQMYEGAYGSATPFSLQRVVDRTTASAQRAGGDVHRELSAAAKDIADWEARTAQLSPSERLKSFRQMRSALTQRIEQLRGKEGAAESARALRRVKSQMDAVVAGPSPNPKRIVQKPHNRGWWAANEYAADDFAIQRAASEGRALKLQEGAPVQEAKSWYEYASKPERAAFKQGLARQVHDMLSRVGDDHDVSKLFRKGGSDAGDEGISGLLHSIIGPREAKQFLAQIEREHVARSTFGLNKGSQTSALQAAREHKGAMANLANAYDLIKNPFGRFADYVIEGRKAESNNVLNEHLGRMLATDTSNPLKLEKLIDELRKVGLRNSTPQALPFQDQIELLRQALTAGGTITPFMVNHNDPRGVQ